MSKFIICFAWDGSRFREGKENRGSLFKHVTKAYHSPTIQLSK